MFLSAVVSLADYYFTNNGVKICRRQHVFSVWVIPYWIKLSEEIMDTSSVEAFKLRLDAQRQSLFPEVPDLLVLRYSLPNLFHPVVSYTYAITVTILGRL